MNDDKEFLGTAPVGRLLLKLSIPTVIAQLINMLYNIIDRIYIGNMKGDGDLALTGLGVCLPIIMLVSAFAALIGTGGAPRASIYMGQNDYDKAEKTLGGCFTTQIIISFILTGVLLIFKDQLLWAFGASENTITYASKYLQIYAFGTLAVQLTLGMNMFISAQGFTKISMFAVLIGAVLNICLDPIFIFGFKMGVQGAALATVISQAVSAIWIIFFLCSKKSFIKIKKENLFVSPKFVLPCLTLGTATFIMQASESVIMILFNKQLQTYGGDIAVGAMAILSSVMQFAMLPLQGIGQGAQPICSYNYGAKNTERVKKTFWCLLIASCSYALILYAFVMICPQALARMFTPKQELIDYTCRVMRIYFAVMFIFGVQMACQMTFVSIGYAAASICVAIVRKFVLLLPFIFILPKVVSEPAIGVYLAEPCADILAVTFTVILFSIQFKKALKKLEASKETNKSMA